MYDHDYWQAQQLFDFLIYKFYVNTFCFARTLSQCLWEGIKN